MFRRESGQIEPLGIHESIDLAKNGPSAFRRECRFDANPQGRRKAFLGALQHGEIVSVSIRFEKINFAQTLASAKFINGEFI